MEGLTGIFIIMLLLPLIIMTCTLGSTFLQWIKYGGKYCPDCETKLIRELGGCCAADDYWFYMCPVCHWGSMLYKGNIKTNKPLKKKYRHLAAVNYL